MPTLVAHDATFFDRCPPSTPVHERDQSRWQFVSSCVAKVRDGFYLKAESRLMGITALVGAVGWYVIEIQDFNIEVFPLRCVRALSSDTRVKMFCNIRI